MGTNQYFFFFSLTFLCEILGTISGFGSSVLFVPLASLFFDFREVLAITALYHVFSNLSKIGIFYKSIDKDLALKMGLPAVLFVSLGAWLSQFVNAQLFQTILNVFLILLCLFIWINNSIVLKPTTGTYIISGASSGFLAGIVGTGGAVRGFTLAALNIEKETFVATSAMIDMGVDTSRAIVYFTNDYFQKFMYGLVPGLLIISLLGSYIGKKILSQIPEEKFKNMVLFFIMGLSIYQLADVLMS